MMEWKIEEEDEEEDEEDQSFGCSSSSSSSSSSSDSPSFLEAEPDMPTSRILIADDNPQGVELLEAYLSGGDYEIQTAADGEETLRKVREFKPDVLLLDVMMPKISGFEVCKRLKANPETADIMVLMVTALDQPSDIDRAVDAKTDDFLTKPINKTELLIRVKAALDSRKHKNQLDRALAYIDGVQGNITTGS